MNIWIILSVLCHIPGPHNKSGVLDKIICTATPSQGYYETRQICEEAMRAKYLRAQCVTSDLIIQEKQ